MIGQAAMIDIFSWKRSAAIGPAYSILDQFVSIPKKKKDHFWKL